MGVFFVYISYTMKKGKSLCKGKRVSAPNKCTKVRGCKVAKGTQRTFCRKAKNGTRKTRSPKNKSAKRRK
jgi:hypothetical protein